ncbi:YDG domain-containing protein [Sphingomonas sp. 1185]|uniref:YDG domain-containing protein n=1 Tax=Sphingomonas sp. 1185 TaxID=3156411 RepID=UPI003396D0D0
MTVAAGALLHAAPAFAQVSGGRVVAGQATISGQGTSQTTITQTSDRAIVNWDRFSLREGDMAVFQQPDARSITVNRVTGGDPSSILGSIQANGQVVLINRNGVLFGKGSKVDTAGLIVSTHDIDAQGFMRGDSLLRFNDGGNNQAEIVVEGRITIRDAGMAAFVAPHVRNSGLITADMGRVSLAAGKGFGIDLYGDGLVRFATSDAITSTLKDAKGKPIKALVENNGTIAAQGGKILLTATAAREVVNASVNVAGIVRADSVSSQGGVITLSGPGGIGTETGSVISVAGASGGSVTITGGSVGLGGLIDASSTGIKQTGGTVAVKSDGLLSLGSTTLASSLLGSGGTVTYQAGRLFENNGGRTNVSGLIDGGTIRSLISGMAMSSGRYFADGVYGLGGRIDMTAMDLRLLSATVAATGRGGGGLVRLGGPFQGGKTPDKTQSYYNSFLDRWGDLPTLATAGHAFVNDGTLVDIASSKGQGGAAVIWSDARTTFLGSVDARGSGAKGSGGAVEISSGKDLRRADLGHVLVGGGHLLLDPKNIIIGDLKSVQSWAYQGIIGKAYASANVNAVTLTANEQFGYGVALNATGDRLAVGAIGADGETGGVQDSGAVYLFTFTDGNFGGGSLASIIGKNYFGGKNIDVTNIRSGDWFGYSVALNAAGDRLAVGAVLDSGYSKNASNSGAVYLFSFTDTMFSGGSLQAIIGKGYDSNTGAKNIAVSTTWFGGSVSLNATGDKLAVGSHGDSGFKGDTGSAGAVRLFSFTDYNFSGGKLEATIGKDYDSSTGSKNYNVSRLAVATYFGKGVALNAAGDKLAVGALGDKGASGNVDSVGAVYLFSFDSGSAFSGVTQRAILGKGYSGANDINLSGLESRDVFGSSVSLNAAGDRLAVGATGDGGYANGGGTNAGAVYLFGFSSNTNFAGGQQQAVLGKGYTSASGAKNVDVGALDGGDLFGVSVSLNALGNRLAVGASGDGGAGNRLSGSGAVRLFSFADTNFTGGVLVGTMGSGYTGSRNVDVSTIGVDYHFGSSVSLNANGDRLAVGASGDFTVNRNDSNNGAVYLFSFIGGDFSGGALQGIIGQGYTGGKNFNVSALQGGDLFGSAVALNAAGDRLAVGAWLDDGYQNATVDSGAVYLFAFNDTNFSGAQLRATVGKGYDVNVDALVPGDRFGTSVSLNGAGNLLAVGAQQDGGSSRSGQYGSVYLLNFSDNNFSNGALIAAVGRGKSGSKDYNINSLNDKDHFGSAVSLSGDGKLLAVGANNTASGTGSVYLMSFDNSNSSDPYKNPAMVATIGKGYSGSSDLNLDALSAGDRFGSAVALNAYGYALAVGAPGDKNSGAAYLFNLISTNGNVSGVVKRGIIGKGYTGAKDVNLGILDSNDQFGSGVSLNKYADRLVVGAWLDSGAGNNSLYSGAAYLFGFSDTSFTGGTLLGTIGKGYIGDGGRNVDVSRLSAGDAFGTSVALNGDATRMAIGAPGDAGFDGTAAKAGAVYLFTFNDGNFNGGTLAGIVGKGYFGGKNVNVGTLVAGDLFGQSVALNGAGDRLAVGAVGDYGVNRATGAYTGAVYLFAFSDGNFSGGVQHAVLGKGFTGGKNYDVSRLSAGDAFGHSVSFDSTGKLLAVGAHLDSGASKNVRGAGAVYLFSFADLTFSGATLESVIGKGYAPTSGTAKYRDVSTLEVDDYFGVSVSLNAAGDKLAVGTFGDDGYGNSAGDSGAVYIFSFDNTRSDAPFSGGQQSVIIGKGYDSSSGSKNVNISSLQSRDGFGISVSLNIMGDRLAVGAWDHAGPSSNATTTGGGAVYLIGFSDSNLNGGSLLGVAGKGYTGGKNIDVGALETNDGFGRSVALAANGARLVVGASRDAGYGNTTANSGAAYLFSFADTSFAGGKLMGTAGKGYTGGKNVDVTRLDYADRFGASVALNARGDRLAVGALYDGNAASSATAVGAVYLFSFTDTNFTGGALQAVLGSGYSGGKNVNVGSLGKVRGFGASVALSADATTLAVGATSDGGVNDDTRNSGSVYLFGFTDTNFSGGAQSGKLGKGYGSADGSASVNVSGLQASDLFGSSVSLNAAGTRLAVGAPGDQSGTGAVYLFNLAVAGTSPVALGKSKSLSVGLPASSNFGSAVSLNAIGDRLAVGAVNDQGSSGSGSATGAVYLFGLSMDGSGNYTAGSNLATIGAGYTGSGKVNVSLSAGDNFGSAVSLNALGNRLAIGASGDDGAARSSASNDYGAAYIFDFTDTNYGSVAQQSVLGKGYSGGKNVDVAALDPMDHFGSGISLNAAGDLLAVGSITDAGASNLLPQSGAVYLFSATSHNAMTQSYGFEPANLVTLKAADIASQLAAGTAITLQASNDITVNSAITVSGSPSNVGGLTLQAGRSVLINANITTQGGAVTLIGNDMLANGVVDAQRDSGAAAITMASGIAINAGAGAVVAQLRAGTGKTNLLSGDITLTSITGGTISAVNSGTTSGSGIVLASGASLTASGTGNAIVLAGQKFTNNSGSSALAAANGNWQVWSINPANDTVGGLVFDFKQYAASYGSSAVLGSGSGLFYTLAPTLGATLGASSKTYDGTTTATVNGLAATGMLTGDTVTLAATSASYDLKTAGTGKTVTASGLSIASATSNGKRVYGYALTSSSVANTASIINAKALSVTGVGVTSKVYDGGTTATLTGATLSGLVSGDTVNLSGGTGVFNDKNAGSGKAVIVSGYTISGTDAGNYTLAQPSGLTGTITAKALSIGAPSIASKAYDGTTAAGTLTIGSLSGLVGSETLGVSGTAAALTGKNVGSYTTTVAYTLADGSNGGLASNYTLASITGVSAAVIAKSLTIGAPNIASRAYDGTTSAGTLTIGSLSGLVGSETLGVSGTAAALTGKNVGNYMTTVAYALADGSNGGLASNYTLTSTNGVSAAITAKALSISGTSISAKTYDGLTSAGGVNVGTVSGLIGSETLGVTGTAGALSSKNVGSYTTAVAYTLANGSNGGLASNYSLGSTGGLSAEITPAALTLSGSFAASDRVYDTTTLASIATNGLSMTGVVAGDTVSFKASGATGHFANKNVGANKTVTLSASGVLTGADAGNYVLAAGTPTATATITPASLTVGGSFTASDRSYDATTVAAVTTNSLTVSGVLGSDAVSLKTSNATGNFANKNVGTNKTVTLSASGVLTGADAGNYVLASGAPTATATITPASLTLGGSFTASDRSYDATAVAAVTTNSLTVSGVLGSDSVSLKTSNATGSFANKNVGANKTVSLSATGVLTGADIGNYVLASGAPTATATITPASLVITGVSAANKIYDGTTAADLSGGTITVFGGDAVTLSTANAVGTFANKNVGTGKAVTASGYAISGTDAGNYALVQPTGLTADITARTLNLSGSFTAQNKVYDATTTASINTSGLSLSNAVAGDDVQLSLTGATGSFANKNVGNGKVVTLSTAGSLTGADAGNYTFTASAPTTTANITPASLMVTGVSVVDKVYDAATTATLTGGAVSPLGSDVVTLVTTGVTSNFADKNAGSGKAVTVSGYTISGTDAGNYTLTQPSGLTGTITAKSLTIGAPSIAFKAYDGTTAAGTLTIGSLSGLVGSETLGVSGTAAALTGKNVGNYTTMVSYTLADGSNGGLASNYALASTTGVSGAIVAKSLTIGAPSIASKAYDGTAAAGTLTLGGLSGLVGSETLGVSGTAAALTGKNVGSYTTTVAYALADGSNGGLASNYTLTSTSGVSAAITAKALSISGTSISAKIYDGTTSAGGVNVGTVSGLIGSETLDMTGTGVALSSKNVGSYTTAVAYRLANGSNGGLASNYTLSATSGVSAIITAKALAVTGVTVTSKVYDGTAAATLSAGSLSGLVSGDTVVLTDGRGLFADKNVGAGKTVTASGYGLSGTDAGNYTLLQPSGLTGTITSRALGVSGSFTAQNKVYDAGTAAIIDVSGLGLSNAVAGDDVHLNLSGATGSFSNKNVGVAKTVTLSTAGALTGADAGNYSFTASAPTTTATITPASLIVAGVSVSGKVYDASTIAYLTGGSVNPLASDVVTLVTTGASGAFANKNVGTGKAVTASGYIISGSDAGNYTLVQPSGLTADITQASLAISGVTAASKVYDATRTAGLSGGRVTALGSDVVTLVKTGASGEFADKNVGTGKAVTASGYTISGTDAGNYALVQPVGLTADVTRANLSVTGVTAAGKVYDATTAAVLSGGSVTALGSDVVTLSTSGAVGRFASKNVGTGKTVTASGYTISGTDAGNYALIQPTGVTADITARMLGISGSFTARDKVYDATTTASIDTSGLGLSNVVAGDDVGLNLAGASGRFADKNVGTGKLVTLSTAGSLTGADAGNYSFAASAPTTTASITPATLNVAGVSALGKVYDASTIASLTGGSVRPLGSDAVTLVTTGAVGAFADKNVGTGKSVLASGYTISGTDAGNYTLAQPTGLTADITRANLFVVGVTVANKIYDATTAAALSGGGVTAFGSDVVTLSKAGAVGAFADKNVGTGKTVTASGYAISGTDAGNYTLVQPTALTANITQASLLVTGVTVANKVYDAGTSATLSGGAVAALSGDVVSLVTTSSTGSFASKNVGTGKAVTASGYTISGTDAGNYTLVQPTGLTANITQAVLAVTGVTTQNKVYDSTTTAALSGGMVTALGHDVVLLSTNGASGAFADKNVGTAKAVTASGYAISGTDAGNYALVQPTGLTADITQAALAVTGVAAQNKVYDATTTAALSGGAVTPLGQDVVILSTLGAVGHFDDKNVGSGKRVSVSGFSISGADAGNYLLVQPTGLMANITPATLSVVGVRAANKTYDANTLASLSGGAVTAFVGDAVTLVTIGASGNFRDKNVGTGKTVLVSGYALSGTDAGNYLLAQPTGLTADISRATLVARGVTAQSKVYDAGADAALIGGVVSALPGDVVTLLTGSATGRFADKNVGSGKVVTASGYALSGADAGNYILVQPTGLRASITPASLTLAGSFTARNKVYDTTTLAQVDVGGLSIAGVLSGDTVGLNLNGATGSFADKNVGTAKIVTLSTAGSLIGLDASNYVIVSAMPTTMADISRANLAVTGVTAIGKVYDATTVATLAGGVVRPLGSDVVTLSTAGAVGRFVDRNAGTAKAVMASGYAISGTDAGNYTLIQPTGLSADITRASLTVQGVSALSKVYDATVDATLSGGTVSALGADAVTLSKSGASGRFADKNAGVGKAVTASGYVISGADAGNYLLVQPTGLSASITPASLTLAGSFTARNKVYDATVAAQVDVSGLSLAGVMAGDTVGLDLRGANGVFADKNVGNAKRVMLDAMGALTGMDAGNYRLVSNALTATADITPANLAVSGAMALDKTYDATTVATLRGGTVSALSGDVVTLSAAGASGRFADKNVGTAKMVTASGYAISGADARNYTLIQPTGLTATITRATLVVDGMMIQNRSYDAGTGATFAGGEVRPLAQDAVQLDAKNAQARFATKNVGNGKAVSVSGLTLIGADAGNYALVQPTGLTADITPAQLFVTGARAADKVYDATTLAAISGGGVTAFAGDSVTLDTEGVRGAFANRMAGVGKTVTVSGYTLGGADAGNYSVVQPIGLTATITPAQLSVKGVTVANKVYDGNVAASTSGGFVTALAPDTVALVTTGAVARFEDRNVGTGKIVIASGYTLGGADAGNYTIVQPTGLTADITRLASVLWTGKGDGKSWFDPANWAGRAIPDGANVADVVLPASTAINFDGVGRVSIDRLLTTPDADAVPSSTDTALTLLKGNLVVAQNLSIDTLIQRGGALTGAGNVKVLDAFTQTGGSIAMTGDVVIHQGAADLKTLSISGRDVTLVGDQAVRVGGTKALRDLTIIAGGDAVLRGPTSVGRNLSVTAGKSGTGRILQDQYVTVTGNAVLNAVGDITLTNSGNHFGGTVSCTSGAGKISGSCTAGGSIDQARVAADNLAARAAAISSASGGGLGAASIGAGNLFTGGPATVGGLLPGAPAFKAMAGTPVSTGATGVAALLRGEPADATIAGGAGSMLTDTVMTSKADTTYVTARFGDQDAKAVYRQVVPQTNLGNAVYYVGN